jgi:TIR domain-containing protein
VSDIFVSYASEDREQAAVLARALQESGWSIWWDRVIPTGEQFADVIKEELDSAKCVVVLWSHQSTSSQWVRREASLAVDQHKLFPALIEDVPPPWEFSDLQACDLVNWSGTIQDPKFQRLATDLRGVLGSPPAGEATVSTEARPGAGNPSRSVGESPAKHVDSNVRPESSRFQAWLERIPVGYAAIGAALAAVLGLFAPDRLIPEPLQGLRPVVSLYVATTFVLAWAWRGSLRRGLKRFATITFLLAIVFAGLNVLVVRPVSYSRGDQTVERHFLTGLNPAQAEDAGQSAEDLIKTYGDGWSDLAAIWGSEFVWIAVGYALTYLGLILGMVFSVAASDLVQSRKRP